MLETTSNREIQNWIESIGGYVLKVVVGNKAGINDIIACVDGHFVSIESKVGKNTSSELQSAHAKKVYNAGGLAICAYNYKEVKLAIIKWRQDGYPPRIVGKFKEIQKFTL